MLYNSLRERERESVGEETARMYTDGNVRQNNDGKDTMARHKILGKKVQVHHYGY